MRKLLSSSIVFCALATSSTPVVAQQTMNVPPDAACSLVTGTVNINGAPQQITGTACQQPDGTWQIEQGDNGTYVSPAATWPGYVDTGPSWVWWGPPVLVGVSFVFVDKFHRFHPMRRVFPGRPHMRPMSGMHGGFHGGGMMWRGMNGGHGR